ncbi:hypothetical protein KEM54_005352 [Ascosphaera aggregata]|nr:hypothetical protein KEM54_005352 [Ascosphaera aggregata]
MPAVPEESTASVYTCKPGSPARSGVTDRLASLHIGPRQVVLRDRVTAATIIPFSSEDPIPHSLLRFLCRQLNQEFEKGDTLPLVEPIPPNAFTSFWFSNFGAVMLLGAIPCAETVHSIEAAGVDWSKICIGSFNIQPNYPGRSSHICSGTFLVNEPFRNRGAGRLMGEAYLEWAPQLGFTYSVFNIVYETNIPSCRIWDSLGFKRIGKIPGCGSLQSYPGQYVDGIIFGRKLNADPEDLVSEERFDKIRYYLKYSKYPSGSDRAEKSRLRSAATHYKLIGGENGEPEKLMLKDKEVISDPQRQLEISREIHFQQHAGINKTTATIALKYHWVRIKETVSTVIKNCPHCKELPKPAQFSSSSSDKFEFRKDGVRPGCQQQQQQQLAPQSTQQYNSEHMGLRTGRLSTTPDIQIADSTCVGITPVPNSSGGNGNYDAMTTGNEAFAQLNASAQKHDPISHTYSKSNLSLPSTSHVMQQAVGSSELGLPLDPQMMSDLQVRLQVQPDHHSSAPCAYDLPSYSDTNSQQTLLDQMTMHLQNSPENINVAMNNTGGRVADQMGVTPANYSMADSSRAIVLSYSPTHQSMYASGYMQSGSSGDQYLLQ